MATGRVLLRYSLWFFAIICFYLAIFVNQVLPIPTGVSQQISKCTLDKKTDPKLLEMDTTSAINCQKYIFTMDNNGWARIVLLTISLAALCFKPDEN
jgi:hypothetical protein